MKVFFGTVRRVEHSYDRPFFEVKERIDLQLTTWGEKRKCHIRKKKKSKLIFLTFIEGLYIVLIALPMPMHWCR